MNTINNDDNQSTTVKGILALVLATLFFAGQDAITKHLTESLPVVLILFTRFFFFALFALIYAARKTSLGKAFKSSWPKLQLLRGVLIVFEIGLFAYALHFLGLAEMHSIFACFPLLITALSVPVLGETVGWRRWLAIGIGFVGTLIIIQPGSGVFSPYALIALATALMFAFYNLITRKVSRQDSFETSLLYFGIVGFAMTAVVVPFFWQTMNHHEISWLLVISATGIIGHLLLIKALELAPAVILQPFNYFILVWATIIGYTVYGEVLGTTTLIGGLLVVVSGVYIAYREYVVARMQRRQLREAMYPPDA